ncbi:hypothetical protein BaRGS_00025603 [Batillaria attramentaria]|uniref:Uncharacterized protein n=1 Tax=Batillaria attramentaria TaxID=370345 RepID=A0ABD0K809_9CAEN
MLSPLLPFAHCLNANWPPADPLTVPAPSAFLNTPPHARHSLALTDVKLACKHATTPLASLSRLARADYKHPLLFCAELGKLPTATEKCYLPVTQTDTSHLALVEHFTLPLRPAPIQHG